MISKKDKIFIAGHNGMVGNSILKKLKEENYLNLLYIDRKKLDLRNSKKTILYLKKNKPKCIIIAAAKVGGILANIKYKKDFLLDNLSIQNSLIEGAHKIGIKNIIFLGSSCVYPKNFSKKIKEKDLLNGPLEKTNEFYALAKIAGIKLCEAYNQKYKTNYKVLMPCNLYGPNDNFDKNTSHFMPSLIRKLFELRKNKKNLTIWGTGKPRREFLHVDDLASACIYFMKKKTKEKIINIGSNKDYSIKEITKLAMRILNIKRKIIFNKSMPDGTKRKKLDISLAKNLGWSPKIKLKQGIKNTFDWYSKNHE